MTAPEILDTQSPYWLRLHGVWIHLQGIMPVNETAQGRQFSELLTVDGHRYEQRAPRGPRSWEFPYRYGAAAATAALESAAYDENFNDPTTRTLLLDTNQAKVNMIPTETAVVGGDFGSPVLIAGGVPLPSIPHGGSSGERYVIPVRQGVTYTVAAWTTGAAGNSVFTVMDEPPTGVIVSGTATGGGTNANPELVVRTFTATADMNVSATYVSPVNVALGTAGAMFFEGDCPPEFYRRGRRMPCAVSVQDPAITNNLIWRYCDPCKLPREHAVFAVREVGNAIDGPVPVAS